MSGKTLSNGTLSLRFMQNAQRAKMQAEVEAEQAKIKDDAEWSVSQEVRDSWGLGSSSQSISETAHESSYLPFIYASGVAEGSSSSTSTENTPKLKGRRTFNANGQEVVTETKPDEKHEGEGAAPGSPDHDEKPRSKFEKRPKSISGFRGPISTRAEGKKARTKTAQMLVHEDIPTRSSSFLQAPPAASSIPRNTGFIKPEGIDAPIPPSKKSAPDGRKRDRDREASDDVTGAEGKKRKKKKEAMS